MIKKKKPHDVLGVWIPNDQIGVVPNCDFALPVAKASMAGGILAQPPQDRPDGHTAFPSLRPQQTQSKPEGADAAPRPHDVALLHPFQFHDARAVIRDDGVDRAVQQRLPQRLAIRGVPDRRAALELGAPVRNGVGRQAEVVEARFDREPVPGRLCAADDRQGVRGREMHDVTAERGEFLLQCDDPRDGVDLEPFRTRIEKRVVCPSVVLRITASRRRMVVHFRVEQEDRARVLTFVSPSERTEDFGIPRTLSVDMAGRRSRSKTHGNSCRGDGHQQNQKWE